MKILFWNLAKHDLSSLLSRCVQEQSVDIILIAEHEGITPEQLIHALNDEFVWLNSARGCDKIQLFAKRGIVLSSLFESNRYLICTLEHRGQQFNIVGLHLEDRRNHPDEARRLYTIRGIVSQLHAQERETACQDSIIIGDFNADPFDRELIQFDAFNATLFKDVLRSESRSRNGDTFSFMYNPIVEYLSEKTKNYGSYYYADDFNSLHWHCFDQVIVSRSLANHVNDLVYLRQIGDSSLMSKIRPNINISDHLPLVVSLEGDADD